MVCKQESKHDCSHMSKCVKYVYTSVWTCAAMDVKMCKYEW
jgi:hypothetical protein